MITFKGKYRLIITVLWKGSKRPTDLVDRVDIFMNIAKSMTPPQYSFLQTFCLFLFDLKSTSQHQTKVL